MENNGNSNKQKSPSFIRLLLVKLFGGKKQKEKLHLLEEEQMQTPGRTIVNNFMSNKVSMTAISIFFLILLLVIIGPYFFPMDLSYSESSQVHFAPGQELMDYPEEIEGNVRDISTGPSFSVAIDNEGQVYVWGKTKLSESRDLKDFPSNMGDVVQIAAGYDHIVALNEDGQVFAWGNNRQNQAGVTDEVKELTNVKSIDAGYQSSMVLTEDGRTFFFGNTNLNDYNNNHAYQGQIDKIALASDAGIALTYEGDAVYLGMQQNSYANIPEGMGKLVDVATTASTAAVVNDQGQVFVWGNISNKYKENNVAETDSKIISIEGGRYHYTAMTEDNDVVAWGANQFDQSSIPDRVNESDIVDIYTGFYQNYAITDTEEIITFGLKGYVFGTDDLGRDILTRLINGGRMSITIGAIAVIISTVIGVLIGSVSGYFGGTIDLVLQRLTEMVASLPFLPFVMILSALIGHNMEGEQKVLFIMVLLGLMSWTGLARLVRAQVLSVREEEYVTAARSVGIKTGKVVFRHILPNVISVIIVSATLSFATSMLTEATLSFLGFGVPAPQPTWGNMLYGANNSIVIQDFWWRWVFVSIILSICVICINLIGDGLRDAVDPKSGEK